MQQQQPNGFAAHLRHQPALDCFLGHQPHGPAGTALRRRTADHGDDALLLAGVKHGGGSGPRPFVKGLLQTPVLVPPPDLAHRFGRQPHRGRNLRGRAALVQATQDQRPQHRAHRLHAGAQDIIQLFTIALAQAHVKTTISPHVQVWAKPAGMENVFNHLFKRSET